MMMMIFLVLTTYHFIQPVKSYIIWLSLPSIIQMSTISLNWLSGKPL